MPEKKIITLLTDFGLSDVYVGVMKGVIAQINPTLPVVDLTHQIPPQNIAAGRFCLMNAVPYFPAGTIHVAVVDPGVGSHRRAIAVEFSGGFLVGPDNGLFSGVLSQNFTVAAVELTNPKYWRTPAPSSTFHGRDIFAPAGAYLASGIPLTNLGKTIDPKTLVDLSLPACVVTETEIAGTVQYIDHFGNLVTNIPGSYIEGQGWVVVAGSLTIPSGQTYSDTPSGTLLALIGSHGWVEIAVSGGSADSELQKQLNQLDLLGVPVRVVKTNLGV
ncbi:MAG: SAM-dependent chlorinase/fluorinase [Microcoleus vaginatus WJT46-NPBG5]|jgi:S-adenosylmethionine hydrolase|nr:SAM-dependent chlorinase/fluorinase [Microcoleus vaginatus WJT46-NPBG5]